jgi:hypothetical protein
MQLHNAKHTFAISVDLHCYAHGEAHESEHLVDAVALFVGVADGLQIISE